MGRDTAYRPARTNAKGQGISVPAPDLNPDRLRLKPFSWQVEPEPQQKARP